MSDQDKPKARNPGRKVAGLVVGTAAVAAILLKTMTGQAPLATGQLVADSRTTVDIGERGVAVAEPGAELSWSVDRQGSARVEQLRGDVFYRVDRARSFVVHTPAGNVAVIGTCFRVAIDQRDANVVVTVYEGSVLFADKSGGTARVDAGGSIEVGR